MFEEDENKKTSQPKDLEPCSLDELKDYIEKLKAEILRAEEEIKRKKAHMDAASSIFK